MSSLDGGSLDGRVAIITGAGRGIGREHALLMAAEGAKIVVNDLGGAIDGSGNDQTPAEEVVGEIRAMGGEAVANYANVTDWEGVQGMVNQAVEAFGDLHILINNAGILRDRVVVNMTEAEWDAVIDVHMKGHFVPTRWAAAYWREQSKAGNNAPRAIVNTASGAMLGNLGQFNYSGAKAAIAAMTLVAAGELGRYNVKVNCLAPIARTRLTLQTPGLEDVVKAPDDPSQFDKWDPANISPLVAYLSTADCPFTGGVFHVGGNEVGLYGGWSLQSSDIIATDGRWTVADLQAKATRLVEGRKPLASVVTDISDTFKEFGKRKPTP
jgi:NAD(P)-dependent dehydrogenase (short-subunit alcohol dehydrogenase family)